jgi:hypothetical protein
LAQILVPRRVFASGATPRRTRRAERRYQSHGNPKESVMKKIVLAALAALFALSTPALASVISGNAPVVQQEEGEKKKEGGGGGGD